MRLVYTHRRETRKTEFRSRRLPDARGCDVRLLEAHFVGEQGERLVRRGVRFGYARRMTKTTIATTLQSASGDPRRTVRGAR